MRCSPGPRWRRTHESYCDDRYVLRRREALKRRHVRRGSREIRAVVVGGILLFIRREVTKIRLHRGDIRLVLRIRKLRNCDRGKNADDDDNDQKLDKCKTLFAAHMDQTSVATRKNGSRSLVLIPFSCGPGACQKERLNPSVIPVKRD